MIGGKIMLTPLGYKILFYTLIGIIQFVLIILKLIGALTLSWLVILIPFWAMALLNIFIIIMVLWKFR